MKVIPAYMHGIMDYLGGLLLLMAPNLFGFADVGGAPVLIPRLLGIIILAQALLTDYEVGLFKVMPMRMHIFNDYFASLFLAASPWLFGFADQPSNVWMPHLFAGLSIFVLSLMTEPFPRTRRAVV
ncbi:MAG TPA: SPW repeat protein [Methylomirabilota bacterium]|nr:SPW repeat protein [Methylomirabilota bacterium]